MFNIRMHARVSRKRKQGKSKEKKVKPLSYCTAGNGKERKLFRLSLILVFIVFHVEAFSRLLITGIKRYRDVVTSENLGSQRKQCRSLAAVERRKVDTPPMEKRVGANDNAIYIYMYMALAWNAIYRHRGNKFKN